MGLKDINKDNKRRKANEQENWYNWVDRVGLIEKIIGVLVEVMGTLVMDVVLELCAWEIVSNSIVNHRFLTSKNFVLILDLSSKQGE